jgi:ELWxxDGT repeat protein
LLAGDSELIDIFIGAGASNPAALTNVNGTLFFVAEDEIHGQELWKSDGTQAGTVLVKDIHAGSGSSNVSSLTNANGTLFFRAHDGVSGYELWRSDGTETGTILVKDIRPGGDGSVPINLTNLNGTLFFGADDGVHGLELWKSDGTDVGTVLVKDIRPALGGSNLQRLINVNGTLFFQANDGTTGAELWKSDGTEAGTVLVKDNRLGVDSSSPAYLTNVNGTLFFQANDGTNGAELWKSDGTEAGTAIVKDIRVGSTSSAPWFLINVDGTLFFSAEEGSHGRELWRSDGTEAGTVLMQDIRTGSGGSFPGYLTNVNGTLYFSAYDGLAGQELWKSDGTEAGTVRVKDIRAGFNGSSPGNLTNVKGTLYFRANDGVSGYELWKSDGTEAGTVLLKDVLPGSGSSEPGELTNVNGTLFFVANDGTHGAELWRFYRPRPQVNPMELVTLVSNPVDVRLTGEGFDHFPLVFSVTQAPRSGVLTGVAPNLTYTPNAGFTGEDEFYFKATGVPDDSFEARVLISVVGSRPTLDFVEISTLAGEDEGQRIHQITVTLDAPSPVALTVPFSVGGMATLDKDYALDPLSIPAGELSGSFVIYVQDDSVYEPGVDETVTVTLLPDPKYVLGAKTVNTLFIRDNDDLPRVSFTGGSLLVPELDRVYDLVVRLDGESDAPIAVPLTFPGTATLGDDYSVSSDTITIAPGQRSGFIRLSIIEDDLPEPAETIIVGFGTPTDATIADRPGMPTSFVVVVKASDTPEVSFQVTSETRWEDHGQVTVTATLSNPLQTAISVPFSVSGTATLGADFTPSGTSFEFPAGETIAHSTIIIVDDQVVEDTETTTLILDPSTEYTIGPRRSYTLIMRDNDVPVVGFDTSAFSVWEDVVTTTVRARLSQPSPYDISVPISTSSGPQFSPHNTGYATWASSSSTITAHTDFVMSPEPLLFPAGTTEVHRSVTVINDQRNEAAERIQVDLLPGTGYRLGTAQTVVTVRDNNPLVSISISPTSVVEANRDVDFTVVLSAATNKSVTIPYTFSGTATAGKDYTRPSATSVTIPAGATSATVRIRVLDDNIAETSETVTLTLGSPSNALLSSAREQTLTLVDNDVASVSFGTAAFTIREVYRKTDSRAVIVSLSAPSSRDVYANVHFSGNAAFGRDYRVTGFSSVSGTTGVLKIGAGVTSASITIQTIDDNIFEGNEPIVMSLTKATGASLPMKTPKLTATISDDDKPPQPPARPPANAAINPWTLAIPANIGTGVYSPESNNSFAFPPSRAGTPQGVYHPGSLAIFTGSQGLIEQATVFLDSNFNGVVDFLDLNGNGLQDDDEPEELWTLTEIDGSFDLLLTDEYDLDRNGLIESHEGRLVLIGGVDTSSGLAWRTRLTAPVGVFVTTPLSTVAESLVRIQGFSVPDALLRVTRALGIEGADLAMSNPLYAIQSGDTLVARAYAEQVKLSSVVIQIASLFSAATKNALSVEFVGDLIHDDLAERIAPEDAGLELTLEPVVESIILAISSRTGVVLDPVVVTGAATVISAGARALDAPLPKDFATGDLFSVEIVKTKKVLHGVLADALAAVGEGTRQIADVVSEFTGTNLDDKVVVATAGVIVPPAMGVSNAVVVEGYDGTQYMEFEVGIVGDHVYEVRVDYATTDGTATELDGDYEPVSGTLVWEAGDNASKFIQVPVFGDTSFESDEHFSLLLSNSIGGVIRISQGFGIIVNDDNWTVTTSVVPPSGSNELLVEISDEEAGLYLNSDEMIEGPFARGLAVTVQGRDDIPDKLFLDFQGTAFRPDVFTFDGGTGEAEDVFESGGGAFSSIEHTILSTDAGMTVLRPIHGGDAVAVNWSSSEKIRLGASLLETLTIHISQTVQGIILEDADPDDTGFMRIRSAENAFAPIVFANPGAIVLHATSSNATLNHESSDPEFAGTVEFHVPVTVNAGADQTVDEGDTVELVGSFTDPGTADTHTQSWSVVASNGQVIADGSGATFSFVPEDNGTYTITYTVLDDDGGSTSDEVVITVDNVAPEFVSAGDDQTVDEGATVSLVGSFTDPGTSDTHTQTWSVVASNGQVIANGSGATFSFVPEDNGTYTITYTVLDDDGGSTSDEVVVTVNNVVPQGVSVLNGTLYIVGTEARDRVSLAFNARKDQLTVDVRLNLYGRAGDFAGGRVNIKQVFKASSINRIVAFLRGGNDYYYGGGDRNSSAAIQQFVFGEDGNDNIHGGRGNDVMSGGSGNDVIRGSIGRDILIGGFGKDYLYGGRDNDLLLGSSTSSEDDLATLDTVLANWIRDDVDAALLSIGAIIEDREKDWLRGEKGIDQLIGGLGDWLKQ